MFRSRYRYGKQNIDDKSKRKRTKFQMFLVTNERKKQNQFLFRYHNAPTLLD